MDFVPESDEVGDSSVQSWYGAPQHEGADGPGWEAEYYGEQDDAGPARSVEFLPEVEPSGMFHETDRVPRGRPARPLSASD